MPPKIPSSSTLPSGGRPGSYGSFSGVGGCGGGAVVGGAAGGGALVASAEVLTPFEGESDTLPEAPVAGASCAIAHVAVEAAKPKTCKQTIRFDIVNRPSFR